MKLEDIGFYTLFDGRARDSGPTSALWRCEVILTDMCNFRCPYCRGLREDCKGTMSYNDAEALLDYWIRERLQNIRFSGGEPTLYPHLGYLVKQCKQARVKRIAISTNGSADLDYYKELIDYGVNDISVSLDACCAAVGQKMNGGKKNMWERTIDNIKELSKLTYVTVGMVFTPSNIKQVKKDVEFAHSLGVADIRVISSAQYNEALGDLEDLDEGILDKHPILKYRVNNYRHGRNVRGLNVHDCHKCHLVLDDMAVAGDYHFPCIIYLREGGEPIGKLGGSMRMNRELWFEQHNSFTDRICRESCLDICIDYNNKVREFRWEMLFKCLQLQLSAKGY